MELGTAWHAELVASAALVILILALRAGAARWVQNNALNMEHRRRWLVQVRSVAVVGLVFGLTIIWAEELRTFALSLTAIAVAVTIATKELLLGLSGSIMRTSARAFVIGDRIQVAGFRGDVIDIGALSTKLLEVDELTGRRTGRAISLPNSLLVDKPAVNETFGGTYVLSLLSVPLSNQARWKDEEERLLDAAREECAPFVDAAKEEILAISRKEGLDAPMVDPTVNVVLEKADEIKLLLRYPTPVRQTNRTGQAILRRYLETRPRTHTDDGFEHAVEQSLEQ